MNIIDYGKGTFVCSMLSSALKHDLVQQFGDGPAHILS